MRTGLDLEITLERGVSWKCQVRRRHLATLRLFPSGMIFHLALEILLIFLVDRQLGFGIVVHPSIKFLLSNVEGLRMTAVSR